MKVQAVRAALTMVRSNFSVAVVSRLGDTDALSTGVQTRGNLETYRVRLRWIIRMAWELFEQKDDNRLERSSDPTAIHKQVSVLYRDEIVWVYNELGVISLAQGSLSDALGYLRQAAEENERIEGLSRTAPIYNHIDLNHAIVQMERGNFQSRTNAVGTGDCSNPRCEMASLPHGCGLSLCAGSSVWQARGSERPFSRRVPFLSRTSGRPGLSHNAHAFQPLCRR